MSSSGLEMLELLKLLSRLPSPSISIGLPAAAMCIFGWEYMITMPLSLRFLGSDQSCYLKASYLVNRYCALGSVICFTLLGAGVPTSNTCSTTAWLSVVLWAIMGLNTILVLLRRVWIISSRDNTIILVVLPFALVMAAFILAVLAQSHPIYIPIENLCLVGVKQITSPLRTRIMVSMDALYDVVTLSITLHKVRRILKETDSSTSLQTVLESYSLHYYVIMISINLIALALSLHDPILCDAIIPLLAAVVALSLQRIMLEDVDYYTRDRLQRIRNLVDLNLQVKDTKDMSQSRTSDDPKHQSTIFESHFPTLPHFKTPRDMTMHASSTYDVSTFIPDTPTSSKFTQSEKDMSLATFLQDGKLSQKEDSSVDASCIAATENKE